MSQPADSAKPVSVSVYSPQEEALNIGSHKMACGLSVVATFALLEKAWRLGEIEHLISFGLYGLSLCILYAASTAYHSATDAKLRARRKVFDHAAIYILIAGSYTPFTITVLDGTAGWGLFLAIWSMAIIGVVLKLFFTGRYSLLSTAMYVVMGWSILWVIDPLVKALDPTGLQFLIAGGVAYTVGAILYSIKKIPFNHAIFHCFVVLGSALQFVAVYGYIL